MRDEEVEMLEAKPSLTQDEQARLQRLRLDQEFRRRVAELPQDDEEEDDNETERQERTANRERMVRMVKEDLERQHRLKAEREELDKQEVLRLEQDIKLKQEHRLNLMEKEREEQRQKMQRKHERQEREQEQLLRKQRELHEKQRQEQEENKRFIAEEEKRIEAKRLDELRRKKEQERQQMREMEQAREAEEEEKRQKERLALIRQDSSDDFHKPSYTLNFPQVAPPVPQPPQRGSSYGMLNRNNNQRTEYKDTPKEENDLYLRGFQPASTNSRTVSDTPTKKSVSFDSRLATEIGDKSSGRGQNVTAPSGQRFPPPTVNRFEPAPKGHVDYGQTSQGQGQGQYTPNQEAGQYAQYNNNNNINQSAALSTRAPPSATPPKFSTPNRQSADEANYIVNSSGNTPGVVGAQEVYRDPRDRQLAAKQQQKRGPGDKTGEQMSFKDKMKMFAETAGENTPKYRAKSSRSQRVLEMNLAT